MKNFDWVAFKAGKIAVNCRTVEDARDFLREAEARELLWLSGDKATKFDDFYDYGEQSTYYCRHCYLVMKTIVAEPKMLTVEWILEKTDAQYDAEKIEKLAEIVAKDVERAADNPDCFASQLDAEMEKVDMRVKPAYRQPRKGICHLPIANIMPPTKHEENGTAAKHDTGKPRLSLVPSQIIFDIAEVREYGLKKYGDPENWRQVDRQRYVDAMCRHWLAFIKDPASVDSESGIAHYKHVACNIAFICEMMEGQ